MTHAPSDLGRLSVLDAARRAKRRAAEQGVGELLAAAARLVSGGGLSAIRFKRERARLSRHQHRLPQSVSSAFSVVVPVYNHTRYLRACVESVLAQQVELEVVLVDDASPDAAVGRVLEELSVQDPRVRVLYNATNLGTAATTNVGIQAARHDLVAFLDCDDLLAPRALERVSAVAEADPQVDFWFTDRVRIDEDGRMVRKEIYSNRPDLPFGRHRENLLGQMVTSHLKVVRRSAFDRVGLLNPSFEGVQDYDLALRLSEQCRLQYVPGFFYFHRWHSRSMTVQRRRALLARSNEATRRARDRRAESTRSSRTEARGRPTVSAPLVTVVLNMHAEGDLADAALSSVLAAMREANGRAISTELVIVVDQGDAPTRAWISRRAGAADRVVAIDVGDLSVARNEGVAAARGEMVAFLDGDDLMSPSWLWRAVGARGIEASVLHPEFMVRFGSSVVVSRHRSTADLGPAIWSLFDRNLWTSFVAAPRELLEAVPFHVGPSREGMIEDWQWLAEVHGRGADVVVIPSAVGFIRRRRGSLLAQRGEALLGPVPDLLERARMSPQVPPPRSGVQGAVVGLERLGQRMARALPPLRPGLRLAKAVALLLAGTTGRLVTPDVLDEVRRVSAENPSVPSARRLARARWYEPSAHHDLAAAIRGLVGEERDLPSIAVVGDEWSQSLPGASRRESQRAFATQLVQGHVEVVRARGSAQRAIRRFEPALAHWGIVVEAIGDSELK